MKACLPVAQDRGLESRVYPHLGSAPMLLVVDTETKATRAIANRRCESTHGPCNPLDLLANESLDLMVVSGIGPGALERLHAGGIRVYHTSRRTAGEALEAIGRGALPPVLSGDAVETKTGRGGGRRGRHRHPGGQGEPLVSGGRGT